MGKALDRSDEDWRDSAFLIFILHFSNNQHKIELGICSKLEVGLWYENVVAV